MKKIYVLLLVLMVGSGCVKKTTLILPPETTRQEAEQAVKDAQEEVKIARERINEESKNFEVGLSITMQEAELEQAKALLMRGKYKKAVKVAQKAQEDAYRTKNELLAMVISRNDSDVSLLPGQPGYKEEMAVESEEDYSLQWEAVTYTVGTWEVDRDCLWNIAKNMLGDPWLWKRIYLANKEQIKDPNLIYTGQILIIPTG